jgi:putative transcriptional regulator
VGVTRQSINAIERGRYHPNLRLAFKIARVFGKTIAEVFIYQDTLTSDFRDDEKKGSVC